jgi:tetratricopeptide (TPR) repeat protein
LPVPSFKSRRDWSRGQDDFERAWFARQYEDARPVAEALLDQAEPLFGADHPARVRALQNLALLYQALGNASESQRFADRAASEWQRLQRLAEDHPESDTAGRFFLERAVREWSANGESDAVRQDLAKARTVLALRYGSDSAPVAEVMAQEAQLAWIAGRLGEAIDHYQRAREIFQKAPSDSSAPSAAIFGLAQALQEAGRSREALPYFEAGLSDAEAETPQLFYAFLLGYALACEQTGDAAKGQALRERAQKLLPKADPSFFTFRV